MLAFADTYASGINCSFKYTLNRIFSVYKHVFSSLLSEEK